MRQSLAGHPDGKCTLTPVVHRVSLHNALHPDNQRLSLNSLRGWNDTWTELTERIELANRIADAADATHAIADSLASSKAREIRELAHQIPGCLDCANTGTVAAAKKGVQAARDLAQAIESGSRHH